MTLIEIHNKEQWEPFVSKLPWAQFTQAWAWGEFQTSCGRKARRCIVMSGRGQESLAMIQLLFIPKPFVGGFWLAPRGPVFSPLLANDGKAEVLSFLDQELPKVLAGSLFIRCEPLTSSIEDIPSNWIAKPAHNPAATSRIDLTHSEDELLAAMHQKTRYNIRVAEKHGVRIRVGTADDLQTFLRLNRQTAERDRFTSPNESYMADTYQTLAPLGMAALRLAEFDGQVLAANMEMSYGDTVTYLYGTSSSASRQVMAPYLLHWKAIQAAKAAGRSKYDLWGTNPIDPKNRHYKKSWEGITRFKEGWGGERIDLVGTYDKPLRAGVYRLASVLRRV